MTFTPTNLVACEPVAIGIQKKVADNGLVSLSNKNTLLATKVVFASVFPKGFDTTLKAGDVVYLDARCVTTPWAKSQYEIDGKKVIFVPVDQILAATVSDES